MLLAYALAAARKKINVHHMSAPSRETTSSETEDKCIEQLLKTSNRKEPHDLAVFYILDDITEERQGIIHRIIDAEVPVTVFSSQELNIDKHKENCLLTIIKTNKATFSNLKNGPIALYFINKNSTLIYPASSTASSKNDRTLHIHMIESIEPLCNQYGIDFPMNDASFRILRHCEDYIKSQQWNKIIYLGLEAMDDAQNPSIYPIYPRILEAFYRLSCFDKTIYYAELGSRKVLNFDLNETEIEIAYFYSLATWAKDKSFPLQKAKELYNFFIEEDIENELLNARITAFMMTVNHESPSDKITMRSQVFHRLAVHTLRVFKQYDKIHEHDQLAIILASHYQLSPNIYNNKYNNKSWAEYFLKSVSDHTKSSTSIERVKYEFEYAALLENEGKDQEAINHLTFAKELAEKLKMPHELFSVEFKLSLLTTKNETKKNHIEINI